MLLRYRPDFHPGLAYLCKRLRCFLGGDRPSQTTRQALSPHRSLRSGCGTSPLSHNESGPAQHHRCAKRNDRCRVRIKISAGWYSTCRLHIPRKGCFTVFHLFSATQTLIQYQAIVKLHGVFSSSCRSTASLPSLQFHRDVR